jgi:tRNA threonylcarbamoyladenosine biosynthesis protein TsaE
MKTLNFMKTLHSKNAEQTHKLGESIGQTITQNISIALNGDLGAGKTTFVQGLAKGLGISENYYITSPTFNIVNDYPAKNFTLSHIDLYRLADVDELEFIGFDDLLDDNHIIVVEWPQLLNDISYKFDIEINFEFDDDFNRIISVLASGQVGLNLLSKLSL